MAAAPAASTSPGLGGFSMARSAIMTDAVGTNGDEAEFLSGIYIMSFVVILKTDGLALATSRGSLPATTLKSHLRVEFRTGDIKLCDAHVPAGPFYACLPACQAVRSGKRAAKAVGG